MVAENFQMSWHTIPPSILRVCSKFHRQSVCVARRRHRGCSVFIQEQPRLSHATFADRFDTSRTEMSTNVYTVYASEIVPLDARRL